MYDLMSAQDIVSQATNCSTVKPQVYFLIDGDEIVYVGSTTQFGSRILNHLSSRKQFTAYAAIDCNYDDLRQVEYSYIEKFKPKYNQARREDVIYAQVEKIKKPFAVSNKKFLEFIEAYNIPRNEKGWVHKAYARAKWIEVYGSWVMVHWYPPITRDSVYYDEFLKTGRVKAFRGLER